MFCLKPLRIVNPKYKKQGRNPVEFLSFPDYFIKVPCGLCHPCLKRFQNDWRVRLLSEWLYLSHEEKSRCRFLSLSISPKYYKLACNKPQVLIKHFRDEYRRIFKKSVKYWCITEYGDTTDRFHFHMLVFNTPALRSHFDEIWKFGFVNNKPIIKQRILYCISYITKDLLDSGKLFLEKSRKPKIFCSPGLGKKYAEIDSNIRQAHPFAGRFDLSCEFGGFRYAMPRYLQSKIFSKYELSQIKIDRLLYMSTPPPPYKIGNLGYSNIQNFVSTLLRETNVLHPLILDLYG